MIVVPNQLYSFHYSQVPGFQRIFELSRQHSYAPEGVDEALFVNLPAEDRLAVRRETLDHFPNEEEILQQELELSRHKGDRSVVSPLRDVENPQMQQVLAGLESGVPTLVPPQSPDLPRRKLKCREASGYIKLDDRRKRLEELAAEVSRLIGTKLLHDLLGGMFLTFRRH